MELNLTFRVEIETILAAIPDHEIPLLVQRICENLPITVSINEIRKVVNDPCFDE
jgi:hypothetical protein